MQGDSGARGRRPVSRTPTGTPIGLSRHVPATRVEVCREPGSVTVPVTVRQTAHTSKRVAQDCYARVSTDAQDLTVQRDGLQALGVEADRIYVDHGLSGTTRTRPGLGEALAACRAGDELVVTKLDRLARSLPDARDIADDLTRRSVRLNLGGSIYDPTDPVGRLLFNVLAMVAEFEADLIRARTREGMKVAKAKGRLRGKQPKLSPMQEAHLLQLYRAGAHTVSAL
jgi:DNA invertase Pin-like site-specific DNA recombinase